MKRFNRKVQGINPVVAFEKLKIVLLNDGRYKYPRNTNESPIDKLKLVKRDIGGLKADEAAYVEKNRVGYHVVKATAFTVNTPVFGQTYEVVFYDWSLHGKAMGVRVMGTFKSWEVALKKAKRLQILNLDRTDNIAIIDSENDYIISFIDTKEKYFEFRPERKEKDDQTIKPLYEYSFTGKVETNH